MLRLQDRLYGKIELPEIAWELAETCPVLLRLREIRMANIPFLTHPSFANVDRYEHSIGVAHLAWWWARSRRLTQEQGLALTLAALYHDGATPGYGHLFEEFLSRFGFDHERELVRLLEGTTDTPGGYSTQVFLGRYCKLGSVLPRPSSASSVLTKLGIADLASGKGALGRLIKGQVDFDNIDNVIRASSAMGLTRERDLHPYEVADAFEYEDDEVRINSSKGFALASWSDTRQLLYEKILNNSYEFRAQSALKWAIEECAINQPRLRASNAWCLTDPMLTFEYLRNDPFARRLVDRVRLGNPPELVCSAWFDDIGALAGRKGSEKISALREELSTATNLEVYVNYYVDKRHRSIDLHSSRQSGLPFDNRTSETSLEQSTNPSGILGVVGVSRIEKLSAADLPVDHCLARHPIDESTLCSVFERVCGQHPSAFLMGWIGTQPRLAQLDLFAV